MYSKDNRLWLWWLGTCNWTRMEVEKKIEKKVEKKTNFSCQDKKYCSQMNSCEEAMYYLNTCWLSRLDRDKDWVPCESICK